MHIKPWHIKQKSVYLLTLKTITDFVSNQKATEVQNPQRLGEDSAGND